MSQIIRVIYIMKDGSDGTMSMILVTHAAGVAAYCTHRPVLMPRERRHDFVCWLPRSVNIHNNIITHTERSAHVDYTIFDSCPQLAN